MCGDRQGYKTPGVEGRERVGGRDGNLKRKKKNQTKTVLKPQPNLSAT